MTQRISTTIIMILRTTLYTLGFTTLALAHGNHDQQPLAADADWATRHMAEEHHITAFDAGSFFNLHDYDGSNTWTFEDLMKTYGLRDPSTNNIPFHQKEEAINRVIALYDSDKSGTISFAEFTVGDAKGLKLPDLGFGPGHHGDDEYEYEIHHFEKFHGDGHEVTEEELNHPEDIEHFRKHEEMERALERQEEMDRQRIVEANIPNKFRRG